MKQLLVSLKSFAGNTFKAVLLIKIKIAAVHQFKKRLPAAASF